jgi:hypothetical protein
MWGLTAMIILERVRTETASRRGILRGAALLAGGAAFMGVGFAGRPAQAAQKKLTQAVAGYQGTPKGHQRCDGCVQWQAPAGCKIVDGDIAPSGWCTLYAPKG